MRTRLMVSSVIAGSLMAVAGCSHPTTDRRTAGAAASADRAGAVYTAVLRRYLGTPAENSFPVGTFVRIFLIDSAHPQAASPTDNQKDVVPLSEATRRAISTGVPAVEFISARESVIESKHGCATVRDGGILITLGTLDRGDGDRGRVEVGINGFVACLGATWLTYVVEGSDAAGWRVTGTTGDHAVA
jgi:hypothetical protein